MSADSDAPSAIEPHPEDLDRVVDLTDDTRAMLFDLNYGRDKDNEWTRDDVLRACAGELERLGYDHDSIVATESNALIWAWHAEDQHAYTHDPTARAECRRVIDDELGRMPLKRTSASDRLVAEAFEVGRRSGEAAGLSKRFGILGNLAAVPVPPAPTSVLARDLVSEITAAADAPIVRTPWARLDELTGGLELSSMTVLVGYQGSGKSSFAAQLGAYHAEQPDSWTVYYLGEMKARILAARIVGQRLKRSWKDVLRGKVSEAEMHAVLDSMRLRIIPRHREALEAMRATVAEVKANAPGSRIMLVVDYAQLLAVVSSDMRVSNVEAVRGLQQLVEDEDLVGIVLSQTSRNNSKRIREGTEDSIDLADVGAETAELERGAALLLVLSYQQKDDTRTHEVTVAISKRRFGGPTKTFFDYDGEIGTFSERSAPVKSTAEKEREDSILEALRVHADRLCTGTHNSQCVGRMSLTTLHKGFGAAKLHRVGGNKAVLSRTLARLEADRKIVKAGAEYRLAESVNP